MKYKVELRVISTVSRLPVREIVLVETEDKEKAIELYEAMRRTFGGK